MVAGIIVHADSTLRPLKAGLDTIATNHIPERVRERAFLHAKELFHGGKYLRRDEGWTSQKALDVTNDVVDLLVRHKTPLVWSYMKRGSTDVPAKFKLKTVIAEHMIVFNAALSMADQWMAKHHPDEVCSIVAEDNTDAREVLRTAQNYYRSKHADWFRNQAMNGLAPVYSHIEEAVLFSKKEESPLLQAADICAYIIKRLLVQDARFSSLAVKLNPISVKHELQTAQKVSEIFITMR